MSRFARTRRVYFVEEPICDLAPEEGPRFDVVAQAKGLKVIVPHLPPGQAEWESARDQARLMGELLERERIQAPTLWYYTPLALEFTRHLHASAVVYDCMDELSLFHGAHEAIRDYERELLRRANVVFTGGHSLWEAKKDLHDNVHAFPSSVEAEHFRAARSALPIPSDQALIPHSRVGFFGVLDERFDRALLDGVAARRPDVHFVMLGPVVKIDPASLPQRPNIHYLGQKSYAELPAYLAGWDAAIMPFSHNDATRFISPTKTLEYLAAGRPVVSTSIRDVVRPYGEQGMVHIADDAEGFASAIDRAIKQKDDANWLDAVDAMLSRTSWDLTWKRMEALVLAAAATAASGAESGTETTMAEMLDEKVA
jgi:UDP-galactopyranose mutase